MTKDIFFKSLITMIIVSSFAFSQDEQDVDAIEKARQAKEALLEEAKRYTVHIQGTGSSVIQGALSLEVQKEEIQESDSDSLQAMTMEDLLKAETNSDYKNINSFEPGPMTTFSAL